MSQKRILFAVPLVLSLSAAPAFARTEAWLWSETRVPLSDGSGGIPNSLRLFTDFRYADAFPGGLYMNFLRVGPIWELHPNLFLATHLTSLAERISGGALEPEYRAELEPNFRGQFGAIAWNDRNRLEYRWRPSGERWRYRNQLWLNYAPDGARWIPFVWNEALVDLSGIQTGFTQNRASVGIGRLLTDTTRLNVGYMMRSRLGLTGVWEHDHVGLINLFFAPKDEPILRFGPSGE